jgi:superfamily II DNA or RNA helicase
VPIIADEFHMFGGQQGQGWKKLDTLARHLKVPLFLLSATPNYNDAERVYCVQHILDPLSCRGGYLEFLYKHCETEHNPFSQTPNVLGFRNHQSAAEYLAALPNVFHLPDDLVYTIKDIPYDEGISDELLDYSYNRRAHKMVASQIEMKHTVRYQGLVAEDGEFRIDPLAKIVKAIQAPGSVLVYSDHATIACALAYSFDRLGIKYAVVTGDTPKMKKAAIIQEFLDGQHKVLIGTATLATGTDGMDRVCDTLLIIDDTEDDALRRQLVGRIMPRGDFVSTAAKQVIRLKPSS